MRHIRSLLILACLICPTVAQAIQLHWSSGATDLSFTAATRCTLVAEADSAEQHLPQEWRLLWLADCQIRPLTGAAPAEGPAEACDIHYPRTLAEVASNLVTVGFCPDTTGVARSAHYVLDLPAGSRGKLKAVALDPNDADSSAVTRSGEVTFNGGIDGAYPMAVLRLMRDHASIEFQVHAVGSGLAMARAATVTTPTFPEILLAITVQDDSSLTAVANIPDALPAAAVQVASAEGSLASEAIPPDPLVEAPLPDNAYYRDPDRPIFYPKDFTLYYGATPTGDGAWMNLFHVFYIRACCSDPSACGSDTCPPSEPTDTWFGHAWSRDLVNWNQNVHAFHVSDTTWTWDKKKVWAPSLVFTGTRYYMFYAGVDPSDNQSIGFASTDNLDTLDLPGHWQRESAPVLEAAGATDWIRQAQPRQLRDPYVMPDPASPDTRWLMFFTAQEKTVYGARPDTFFANAVGLAKSDPGDISAWTHQGYYRSTNYTHTLVTNLESPHVFPDAGHALPSQENQAHWRIMYTNGGWQLWEWKRAVLFTEKLADRFSTPVTDLDTLHWSAQPTELYTYLHLDSSAVEYGHQASEVIRVGHPVYGYTRAWYWGGYDGTDLRFRRVVWEEPGLTEFDLANADLLDVGAGKPPGLTRFSLMELVPASGRARFRVELPGATRGTVTIYDVMGRRVRTLVDGQLSPGVSIVSWDGRRGHGSAVSSGVYFARLTVGRWSYTLRVPLVR